MTCSNYFIDAGDCDVKVQFRAGGVLKSKEGRPLETGCSSQDPWQVSFTGHWSQLHVTMTTVYKQAKQGPLAITPYYKANSDLGHTNPLGYTGASTKVVQKSVKAYATMPKGCLGNTQ